MRWLYLIIVILFAAAIVIFALQNLETITVSFLGLSIATRVSILMVVIYLLGALTGGSLIALLRRSYNESLVLLRNGPSKR
jgi:uncharacterized integral membrane protein